MRFDINDDKTINQLYHQKNSELLSFLYKKYIYHAFSTLTFILELGNQTVILYVYYVQKKLRKIKFEI